MKTTRNALLVAVFTALSVSLAACGSDSSTSGGDTVKVGISDAGCTPANLKLTSGAKNFEISTTGSGKVTEYEILDGTRILGERENLTPGVTGKFSLNLPAGEYASYCPNGKTAEYGKVVVTGGGATGPTSGGSKNLAIATKGYQQYVEGETQKLTKDTTAFVAAVKAGDVAKAKALFAPTRESYERIEPVAESFGTLDPEMDARENDVEDGTKWTGFHRIEKTLWEDNTTKGLDPIADKLLADAKLLEKKASGLTYQPAELANGATGLLDEVSKSKITGEEDRYSHTDLYDFAANVDGSQAAYKLLRPALAEKDPELAKQIDERFIAVDSLLAKYRKGDGFVLYTTLTPADTKKLSQSVDALAEPLSKVASQVVGNN
jgi:iron uptake system component EfeO